MAKMQLHARCGGHLGTVKIDYNGWETVSDLKERLVGRDSAQLASDLVSYSEKILPPTECSQLLVKLRCCAFSTEFLCVDREL